MKKQTKKVPCSYSGCNQRRIHWSQPDVMRSHVMIEVPIGYDGPMYCSIECKCYAGQMTVSAYTDDEPNSSIQSESS